MNRLELRSWRRKRWLTQGELADLLGVNIATEQRWEAGVSSIPPFLNLALDQLDYLHFWSPDGIDADPRLEKIS